MFSVKHNECVGFDSRWVVKKVYYEGCTQTPLYEAKNASTETNRRAEVEIQTDKLDNLKTDDVEVDIDKLATFLTKMYPRVKKELDDTIDKKAFLSYEFNTLRRRDTRNSANFSYKLIQNVDVLSSRADLTKETVNKPQLSSISWNCSGRKLAVSLTFPHQSWCYDHGNIFVYTLDRNDELPGEPTRKITTNTSDSCVTKIEFHQFVPAILAGITHSGYIFVWNIQNSGNDDVVLMKMRINENISHLNWLKFDHITLDVIFLVTSSLDGTVSMWKFNNSYSSAKLYQKFKIKSPLMARGKRTPGSGVGITCFDFSTNYPDIFVLGTEDGSVVQCSTSKPTKLKGGTEFDPIYDPVYQYYHSHDGHVISVKFSKMHKNMFITTGADFQARIYEIGQEEPGRIIFFHGSNNASPFDWVPDQCNLVFRYGSGGNIEIYNILNGKIVNENAENNRRINQISSAICCVDPTRNNVVAVGIREGIIELWRIPWETEK